MQLAERMKDVVVTQQKINTANLTRYRFEVITSTQDVADEFVKLLDTENWLLITAEEQTKGRGRTHSRSWASPPHVNIYATFIFPLPRSKMDLLFNIPQITAWSVIVTLEELGFKPKLKWANDIFLNRKKIGGVLCRFASPSHLKDHVAVKVGVGINVNMSKEICDALDQPVTSMLVESGRPFNKENILSNFQTKFKTTVELLLTRGFAPFAKMMEQKMEFMGENVKIKDDGSNAIFEGKIQGFDSDGALLLAVGSKTQKLIHGHIIPQRSIDLLALIGQTLSGFNFDEATTKTVIQYINNDDMITNHTIAPYFTALNQKSAYGANTLNVAVKPNKQKLSRL
jgi:BirA family biotin operon repressor/biotin-[acetyl-CoA-carboxylase] ligase